MCRNLHHRSFGNNVSVRDNPFRNCRSIRRYVRGIQLLSECSRQCRTRYRLYVLNVYTERGGFDRLLRIMRYVRKSVKKLRQIRLCSRFSRRSSRRTDIFTVRHKFGNTFARCSYRLPVLYTYSRTASYEDKRLPYKIHKA